MKSNIYARVTSRIIADLEKGVRPWQPEWNAAHAAGPITRPLRQNGKPYQGINVLLLWSDAMEKGFSCPIWMTYRQAQELSGQVRKGEKGSHVVYYDTFVPKDAAPAMDGDDAQRIPFLKGYAVFNCEQIDGLPEHYYAPAQAPNDDLIRIEHAERFFAAINADIRHGGNKAFYVPSEDFIRMPPFEAFRDGESYYATLAHECVHWTGAKQRLDRQFKPGNDGGNAYANEELVAEIGAAFLCADLGISGEVREDHTAYIGQWLKALKGDKRLIFTAAAHAQRAVDYLLKITVVENKAA